MDRAITSHGSLPTQGRKHEEEFAVLTGIGTHIPIPYSRFSQDCHAGPNIVLLPYSTDGAHPRHGHTQQRTTGLFACGGAGPQLPRILAGRAFLDAQACLRATVPRGEALLRLLSDEVACSTERKHENPRVNRGDACAIELKERHTRERANAHSAP